MQAISSPGTIQATSIYGQPGVVYCMLTFPRIGIEITRFEAQLTLCLLEFQSDTPTQLNTSVTMVSTVKVSTCHYVH